MSSTCWVSYVSPDVGLVKALQESWKQELLVDYTIQVGDEEFKVHKIVMASVSDYFKAMLTGGMMESKTDRVRLEGQDSLAVSNIIEYIYTNRITGEWASPEDLLAGAMYLQVSTAIEAATNMLRKKLNKKNCFDMLTTFDTYSLKKAAEHTRKFITTNMDDILKVHGHAKLTYEHLLVLIQQWKNSEWDLFLTLKDWLDVDYKNRKQPFDSLMSHVRFSLLTHTQLETVKKMKVYSEGSWQNNVQLGLDYHSQPIHKKMMRPASIRSKPQPVCFSDQNTSSIFALEEDGQWTEIDVPETPGFRFGVNAVLEFNNFLVIVEDTPYQTWHVFDTITFLWSTMPSTNTRRTDVALVHDNKYIYALGGSTDIDDSCEDKAIDTIERYDPETNMWTLMPTKLPSPLCRHKACLCSGPFFSIYVAGGWERLSHEGDFSSAMNCFNPNEEPITWHSKAPMLIADESYVMREMAFGGKDPAIIIMCEDLAIQYYDLRTDQWSMWNGTADIDFDWRWHNNGTVLSDPSKNTLYVLNICEDFPDTMKEPDQGVCGKWVMNKPFDILGYPVKKFPMKTEFWEYYAEPDYLAAILAIPRSSKRMIPTPGPSPRASESQSIWK